MPARMRRSAGEASSLISPLGKIALRIPRLKWRKWPRLAGLAAARMLADIGFPVAGWGRSHRPIDGVETYHGAAGLAPNGAVVMRE